jgi:rRNA-processing protein FCF1
MPQREPILVLLDTNFLMVSIRFGVDVEAELNRIIESSFKLATTTAIVDELRWLKTRVKPGEEKEIDFALALAERIAVLDEKLEPGEEVDDQLIRLTSRGGCVVATTDAELRRRLRERSIPVVYLRQRRHLAVDGLINR